MRLPFRRPEAVPGDVLERGGLAGSERVLAHTRAAGGTWLLGTRGALVVVGEPGTAVETIPWQQVETADWDREEETLHVVEVGSFGEARPVHDFAIAEPGRLLQLVRERVTASVLLQRRVMVPGRQAGLTVVARRSPHRDGAISWAVEYDAGLDPADPDVADAAAAGVRAAQEEVGPI